MDDMHDSLNKTVDDFLLKRNYDDYNSKAILDIKELTKIKNRVEGLLLCILLLFILIIGLYFHLDYIRNDNKNLKDKLYNTEKELINKKIVSDPYQCC
jgi:hypothetical protein